MQRVIVRDRYTGEVLGWFDVDRATLYKERTDWNGHSFASVHTTDEFSHQALYRTAGGRWVLNHWSQRVGTPDLYEYVDEDTARKWLIFARHDDVVSRYWGELEEERSPGRPEIGPTVKVKLPEELLKIIDNDAETFKITRAEMIRRLLVQALTAPA